MFDLNTLTKKNIEDLKSDLLLKKRYILKNLKETHSVLSLPNKKPFGEISLSTNGGDIRSLTLYIETIDDKKKKIILKFYLEDFSCGSGKYANNVDNKTSLFNNYPASWQNYFFEHKQFFSLYKINKDDNVEVYDTNVFDEELKSLFDLIYLTNEERKNYYSNENLKNRIRSFKENENKSYYEDLKNIDKNDIKIVEPVLKNVENNKETSWNNSRKIVYDKKKKKIEFIEKKETPFKNNLNNNIEISYGL